MHIFWEHNKEADTPGGREVRGRTDEWGDDSKVVWSEVTGLCGFWDVSFRDDVCGAGVLIEIFTQTLGCHTNLQKVWATVRQELL